MTKKQLNPDNKAQFIADKYNLHVNSTDDFDSIKLYIGDELELANIKCDNFTINEEPTILEDYDSYIEQKEQEKEQKRKNLLEKLLDYLRRR